MDASLVPLFFPRQYPTSGTKYPIQMKLPKYRLHKPSGRAVIQYRPMFGPNPHYLKGAYNSAESLADYRRICKRIIDQKTALEPAPPRPGLGTGLVNQIIEQYLVFAARHYGTGSRGEFVNVRTALKPLSAVLGERVVSTIGPVSIKSVREHMVGLGWSRRHVNAQINRIRRMLRWAVEEELVDASTLHAIEAIAPLRQGRTAARELPPVQPIAWDVVQLILPHVAPVVAAMIELQFLTGMRSDELTQIQPRHIDRSGPIWLYIPASHKTQWRGKKKIIPIGPKGQSLLAPYLDIDPAEYVFSPAVAMDQVSERRAKARKTKASKKPRDRKRRKLLPRYTAASYQHAILHGLERLANSLGHERPRVAAAARTKPTKRDTRAPLRPWLESIGVEYWNPHRLRHTRATLARENYGIEGAQALTGNSLEAAEIYAERSLDLAKRIASETG